MNITPSMPPPEENSPDLTDEEVSQAVPTTSESEFTKLVAAELTPGHASVGKGDARYALHKHELRRRTPNLYWRVYLGCPGEPDKVLVYQVDWLLGGKKDGSN